MKRDRINERLEIFSQRFSGLIVKAHIRDKDLAQALGVSWRAIASWRQGVSYPFMDMLVEIADFFGVPTDYLLGRVDEAGDGNYVNVQRRIAYEKYLYEYKNGRMTCPPGKATPPFPYNLADQLLETSCAFILNEGQVKFLLRILGALQGPAYNYTWAYYVEERSVRDIAIENGVTVYEVGEVLRNATRQLRQPGNVKALLDESSRSFAPYDDKPVVRELTPAEPVSMVGLTNPALVTDELLLDFTPGFKCPDDVANLFIKDVAELSVGARNALLYNHIFFVKDAFQLAITGKLKSLNGIGMVYEKNIIKAITMLVRKSGRAA